MKYLITLKNDLIAAFDGLTPDKTMLQLVNGELKPDSSTVNYIARFTLIDCRLPDPFLVIAFIRTWFNQRFYDVAGVNQPSLNFDCDVIDLETYDIQIDIGLTDKLNIDNDGSYTICPPLVWSEQVGGFINSVILMGDDTP